MTTIPRPLQGIIWDFNGTILSDVELSVEGLNLLRHRRAMSTVTVDQYRDAFGFPVQHYYEGLGFDFSQEDFGTLSEEYHAFYFANVHRCAPHRHIPELMHSLHSVGLRQFVLSAMQEEELRSALDALQLLPLLEGVYGLGDLLARGKVEQGRRLMADASLDPREVVLVGDTDHDVEVARELGVLPITLTIGHQSPHRFSRYSHPQFSSVEELQAALLG